MYIKLHVQTVHYIPITMVIGRVHTLDTPTSYSIPYIGRNYIGTSKEQTWENDNTTLMEILVGEIFCAANLSPKILVKLFWNLIKVLIKIGLF